MVAEIKLTEEKTYNYKKKIPCVEGTVTYVVVEEGSSSPQGSPCACSCSSILEPNL